MKLTIRSFALIAVAALSLQAFAHGKHDKKAHDKGNASAAKTVKCEFLGKGDGVTTCPVTGEEIQNGDYQDQKPKEGEKQDSKGAEKKFLGKGDGVETCPVTGEAVNKNLKYEVNGRVFYVCCEGCADVVKKNPDLFLKPVEGENKKEQEFLGKGDGVETCPVTGEAVDKDLKGEVDGQTFYVCCAGCIDIVKKNPAAYLKKAVAK